MRTLLTIELVEIRIILMQIAQGGWEPPFSNAFNG